MNFQQLINDARLFCADLTETASRAVTTDELSSDAIDATSLEERIMLSASPLPAIIDVDQSLDASSTESESSEDTSLSTSNSSQQASNQTSTEIVFVDQSVENYDQLIADIEQGSANIEIVLVDSNGDGFQQVSDLLAERSGIEAIHFVAHGNDGAIRLGNTTLSSQSLSAYAGQIANWQSALTTDADLMFYGCNLASSAEGQLLIDSLGELTGADIAASDDLTGHTDLGGDWDLEYQTGDIDTQLVFSVTTQADWYQVLATITVDTTTDENDGDTSSIANLIASSGGTGISLREAIIAANNTAGADTITLGAGNYTLSIAGGGEDFAATGDLDTLSNITIFGSGIGSTIIDGGGTTEIFDVRSGSLSLDNLDITNGYDTGSPGGAVTVSFGATLNIDHVDIHGNAANNTDGGGVYNEGTFSAVDSLIRNNDAGNADGGGLYNTGSATLTRVSVINNTAINAAGIDSSGTLNMTNVTVSGNTAAFDGGGLRTSGGSATLNHVSFGDNEGTSGNGGGIQRTGGTVTVSNSIFADNTSNFGGNDLNGSITSGGHNIVENYNGFTPDGTDITGSATLPTLSFDTTSGQYVYAIASGSAAHNAAGTGAPSTDIRGVARDGSPDIGAFELAPLPPHDIVSVGTQTGGLSVNEDGGNDTYLQADDGGSLLGSLTQMSLEFRYSSTESGTILSYASNSGSANNEIRVAINGSDQVEFIINSQTWTSAAYTLLLDGDIHTLSLTWDSTGGVGGLYIDGQLQESFSGLKSGYAIAGGGEMVLSLDQDTVLGGWDTTDAFHGTLYDTRIFDNVRTTPEITANYDATLPYDESNLIANWKFDSLSYTGVVTESVSGNNLTIQHVTDPGFTASSPLITFSVNENSADGTSVGSVFGIDTEREALIATLLANDASLSYDASTQKFYKAVSGSFDLVTARTNAESTALNGINGQLVTIRSAYENTYVQGLASTLGGDAWIGATDETTEGEWHWWESGIEVEQFWSGDETGAGSGGAFQNWDSTQPNDSGGAEDAARLDDADGKWYDAPSTGSNNNYIVEWDADTVLDNAGPDGEQPLVYSIFSQTIAGAFAIDPDDGQITVSDGLLLDYETNPTHSVTVRVTDVDGNTYDEAITIGLIDLAVEPSQTVPGPQSVIEDNVLTFSTANGNAVSVSDTDGTTDTRLQVFIAVNDGVLTLSQTTGLSILGGSNGSGFMTMQGTESDLNAALEGMTFTPDVDFNGSVTLNMTTSFESELQGKYTFDDGSADDTSVGVTQDGTLFGDASIVSDPERGNVLSLDGTGDYMTIPGFFGEPTNITLSTWVNLNSVSGFVDAISLGDNVVLRLNSTGVLGFLHDGSTFSDVAGDLNIVGTGWHHVALVVDSTNTELRLYINGSEVDVEAQTQPVSYDLHTNTVIGRHGSEGGGSTMDGLIDDARIYSRALSADEIAVLASSITEVSDSVAITVTPNAAPTDISLELDSPVVHPQTDQITVNTSTSGNQGSPEVDELSNGNKVIVWQADNVDGSGRAIMARLVDDAGNPIGAEFQINTTTSSNQDSPDVTALSGGGFAVTWESDGQDGDSEGVFTRVFNNSGTAVSGEIQVATTTAGNQDQPKIAGLSDGGFVVVMTSENVDGANDAVIGQRFDAAGVKVGTEFQINTTTTDAQNTPTVAANPLGGFMVAWESNLQDGGGIGIYARVYDAAGTATTIEIQVNTTTTSNQSRPAIAVRADGSFAVVFHDTSVDDRVVMRIFDAAGTPLTSELELESDTRANGQKAIEVLDDQSFVVAWYREGYHSSGSWGSYIASKHVSADGSSIGAVSKLNEGTTRYWNASDPSLSLNSDGTLLAVYGMTGPQFDSTDIVARQVAIASVTEGASNGTVVGTASSIDPDSGDTFTYSLQDTAGGRFAIDLNTGIITVANGSLLDFETATSHDIIVRSTDSGSETYDETMTIHLIDVNEALVLSIPGAQTGPVVFSSGNSNAITFTDIDSDLFQVDISVDDGTLSLGSTANINFYQGDGVDDAAITFGGSTADIAAALEGLQFKSGSTSSATISITVYDVGSQTDNGASVQTDSGTIAITSAANTAPVLTGLDGTPTFSGSSVVLDSDVTISDTELDALNSSNGNYDGASLTLVRNGGISTDDSFSFSDGNGITLSGSTLIKNGQVVATFVTTSPAGQLTITFTDANGETPASADVDFILQQITYSYVGGTGTSNVQVDWTFSDSNDGSQGYGGALTALGNTTVSIISLDLPENSVPGAQNVNEDSVLTFSSGNSNAVTVSDSNSGTNVILQVLLSVNDGILTLSQTTGLTISGSGDGTASMTIEGTESDINAALEGMTFTPDANFNGAVSLNIETSLTADPATTNLETQITFDDGTADDQSGGTAYDGTLTNGAVIVADPERGNVLSLDGVDDSVVISPRIPDSNTITLSAWINIDSPTGNHEKVISLSNNYILGLRPDGTVFADYRRAGGWNSTFSISDVTASGWRLLTYTVDNANNVQRLYIDGVLEAETNYSDSNTFANQDDVIGRNGAGDSDNFTGLIDDVNIFTRALDANEVAMLANASDADSIAITVNPVNDAPQFHPTAGTAVAYYDFENGNSSAVGGDPGLTVSSPVTITDGEGYTTGSNGLHFSTSADSTTHPVSLASIPGVAASGEFSFAAWVNFDAGVRNWERIFNFSSGAGDHMILTRNSTSNDLTLDVYDGGASAGRLNVSNALATVAGTYTHFGVTFDSATNIGKIYIDGVLQGSMDFGAAPDFSTWDSNYIGSSNWSGDSRFEGAMDDIGIFDRVLSDGEMAEIAGILVPGPSTTNYTEGDGVVLIGPSRPVSVSDADSTDFDTGTFTVSFTAGSDSAEDVLSIRNEGSAAGQIGVSGSNVTYGGVNIGSFTGGSGGTDLVVALNSNADATSTSALANNIQYENTDTEAPTTGARTVQYVLTDGDGGTSASYDLWVVVADLNDDPTNAGSLPTDISVTEDVSSNVGLSAIDLSDVDAGSSSLTVTLTTSTGGDLSAAAGTGITLGGTSSAITLTGSLTDLNNYLNIASNITYLHGTANLNGNDADTIQVNVNDNGNTGTGGGTDIDLGTVNVDIAALNNAPAFGTRSFTSHDISTTADGARSVTTADMDGDGDVDVLSAWYFGDTIAWYENDGSENFTLHIITTTVNGPDSVTAVDVDGDGDLDVLSASYSDDTIAWYENDGSENFTFHAITTTANGARSVTTADVDGDGDVDVLSASSSDDTIAWYENDGSENFTLHTISTTAAGAVSVTTADVDGDGDIDVLSASQTDDTIAWYENDGSENFTLHTISTSADGANAVTTADVDGDGDIDVLSASQNDDTVAWYENDGSENFTLHTITTTASGAQSVATADVDGDGDVDVLSASFNDDTIAWYENDGSENFTVRIIATDANGAFFVTTADVDGDGNLDVLSGSQHDDTITWYEQIGLAALDGTPSFIEGGAAVVLDADVDVIDADLDALNSANGNYDGASVTLVRNGGVNADDQFTFVDANGILLVGSNLVKNTQVIATFDLTSTSGQLDIAFTNANGETPTSADVDNILRQITYANSSDAPPASVQIDWTFDDGNTGSQGFGGVQQATGSTTINITAVNDAAVFLGNSLVTNGTFDADLSGWVPSGNVDFEGAGQVRFGQIGGANGVLSQTITTTIGQTYYLTFQYGDANATKPQSLQVQAVGAGSLLNAAITTDVAENTKQPYAYAFVADSTSTTLTFTDTSVDHSGVRGYLDNITLSLEDTPASALSYTENGGAVVVDSGIILVDLDDTNLESATIQITGNFATGEDLLSFVDQNGITGVWNSGAGSLTLTGTATVANYETALRSITYNNSSELPDTNTRTVSFTINDGDIDSNTLTRNISVASINDDPINAGSLPTDIAVIEDLSSDVDLSTIDLSDADHNGGSLIVTLTTSTGGNLTAATSGGVTVGGSGTGTLTLTGTQSDLNAYLDSASNVQYLHGTTNSVGNDADTIYVTVNDNGNTGTGGGADQSFGTANVDITAVNDEEVLATNLGATVVEGSTGNIITTAMLETTDVDNTASQLTYTVDTVPTNGTLYRNGVALIATNTFTQADIDTNLITYTHDDSQTSSDSFDFTVDDGTGSTTSATFNWSVTNSNDAPVEASIESSTLTYTENDGAVAITSSITLSDIDDANLESAVVQITSNYVSGEDTLSFVDQNGITGVWNSGTGSLTLIGTATVAQYETALRSITYTNSSELPDTSTRTVSFTVNDGDIDSNTLTRNISVASINDDPFNAGWLVSDLGVTEDVIRYVDLSTIDLSDVDHNGGSLTVTVATSTGGNLTASSAGGVTVGGSGSGTLTLTGNLTNLNAFIDTTTSFQYLHGTANLNGNNADTISVSVNDNGNTGTGGGTDQALDTVNVDIGAINDAPTVATNTGTTVAEGNTVTITTAMLNEADVDDSGSGLTYSVTSAPTNGQLELTTNPGVAVASFTQDDIDNNRLVYVHDDSETASDSFDFSLADGGENGATPATGTFNVSVSPVTDNAPIITSNGGGAVAAINAPENSTLVTTVAATDADVPADTLTYSIVSGNDSALFTIDSVTGVLSFATSQDMESPGDFDNNGIYEVVVQVSDGTFNDTQAISVSITDVDEFDTTPINDTDGSLNSVSENAGVGTTVGITAFADDADATDTVSWSLDDDDGGRFSINSATGVVTVTGAIDREADGATRNITIRATSTDGSAQTTTIAITINDVDEYDVGAISDTDAGANEIDENSIVGTSIGITTNASDNDATNNSISWSLSDDDGGRFSIDSVTGEVVLAGTVDREADGSTRSITVRATSTDSSYSEQIYTVNVNDIDEFDVSAINDADATANIIDENMPAGTMVGITALATDADATNNTITYSLLDDDGGRFTIDNTTGVITTAMALDYEVDGPTRTLIAQATSSDGSQSTQTFNVDVNDINEAPTLTLTNQVGSLGEDTNTTGTTKVADIIVSDDALGSNLLSLSGADASLFEIVGSELHLKAGVTLDYESQTQLDVVVSVDDSTVGSTPDGTAAHSIAITDVDDTAPVIQPGQVLSVDENSPLATLIGSLIATDIDTSGALTDWTISAGNGDQIFGIEPYTGDLYVDDNINLNFEANTSYVLLISVSDGIQTSAVQSILVNVQDVNDRPVAVEENFVTDQFEGILVHQPGVLANDSDEDGDSLTAVLVTGPANGTVSLSPDGSLLYTPTGNFYGTDSFTYLASDGNLQSAPVTVEVVVRPVGVSGDPGTSGPSNPPKIVITKIPVAPPTSPVDGILAVNPQVNEESSLGAKSYSTPGDDMNRAQIAELIEVQLDTSRTSNNHSQLAASMLDRHTEKNDSAPSYVPTAFVGTPLSLLPMEESTDQDSSSFDPQSLIVGSTAITSATLSVGYIIWLVRGGTLLASFVSALPAWTSFDPLPIIKGSCAAKETESLSDIARNEETKQAPRKSEKA